MSSQIAMIPFVSIIIPVYKVEKYLNRCLDSILSQTFANYECILVDDNSPDNCPVICDEYVKNDSRFKVIHKNQNEGTAAARKSGLDMAISDFILNIDSDDWIEPDMLDKMYKKAISGNYDMVWCDYYEEYSHESKYIKVQIENLDKVGILKELIGCRLSCHFCTMLIKRQLYKDGNIYFPSAHFWEEFVQAIQYIYHAKKIGYVNSALYHYNKFNPNSITNNLRNIKVRNDIYENLNIAITFLKSNMDISDIEPEISFRVNGYKLSMLRFKETRDMDKLFSLFPESHKYIFDKRHTAHPISKSLLFLATKKIMFPYKILDIVSFLKNMSTNSVL